MPKKPGQNQPTEGLYTIVAPGTIHSDYAYDVSVALHKHNGPATIDVGISGPSFSEVKTIKIKPFTAQVVHFDVPPLEPGTYELQTTGRKGLRFEHNTRLNHKEKSLNFYIQTDKAQYKPGDLVQYRVVALDESLKPAKLKQFPSLLIQDGDSNKIRQINEIQFYNGVFTDNLQLSEQPVLGKWRIDIMMGDDCTAFKRFEVDKYVLPRFSVELLADKKVAVLDRVFKVTVCSKYTYDQPVKGKACIKACLVSHHARGRISGDDQRVGVEKTMDIDGKGEVEFDIMDDLKMDQYNGVKMPRIRVEAIMKEAFTDIEQTSATFIDIERSRYTITVPKMATKHEVNKPFEITAIIQRLNGCPVTNARSTAKLMMRKPDYYPKPQGMDVMNELMFESEVNQNGVATFVVKLSSSAVYRYVTVMFEEKVVNLPQINIEDPEKEKPERQSHIGGEYVGHLKLLPQTKEPALGEEIVIDVKSQYPLQYFVYTIMGRGKILKHEYVTLKSDERSGCIKIMPTFEMVPTIKVFAYYINRRTLKYDEITIDIPTTFANKLEITTASETAKPSEMVTLNIKTDPQSYVGVLGVDQSVLLLQSGNDLDERVILQDFEGMDSQANQVLQRPGRNLGFVTLTNALHERDSNHADYAYSRHRCYGTPNEFEVKLPSCLQISRKSYLEHESDLYFAEIEEVEVVQPKIRKDFVESWIFDSIESTDANGLAQLTKKIPDTITSWIVTGISLNEHSGLGMTQEATKIRVFQPFFLSTNLPYAIKRGEVITIPVIVFNYMESQLDAQIIMENSDGEYDFVEEDDVVALDTKCDKLKRMKSLSIPSNTGETVKFTILPNVVGEITLKIKAITPVAGDAIHQKLKVEPEGVTHYQNEAFFITMPQSQETMEHSLKANIPSDAVLDSEYIEFSAMGDILGPTIKNIDHLVRMPYGCGEQNMVNFVPNILVLHYLDVIKADMPSVVEKAKNYMEKGYQRELTYKHKNGAYSAFGEQCSESNSWLTAYVARSFIQARKYITISNEVIEEALQYLISTQTPNGQFPQTGQLFYSSNQNEVGVSAFIMLALLEDPDYASLFKSQIDIGLQYLVDTVMQEDDVYTLSLVALVFQKVKHPHVADILEKLQQKSNSANNLKWWSKAASSYTNIDIEITALVLQALVVTEEAGNVLPIVKWLIGQRNSCGGFGSTRDTVVGLEALIKFAEKYHVGCSPNMSIAFEVQNAGGDETAKGSFNVNMENALLLQSHVLPKSSRQLCVTARGQGSALVQLAYRYNLASPDTKPNFLIQPCVKSSLYPGQLLMNIVTVYQPYASDEGANAMSNMVVMEIFLPSGYTTDDDSLKRIRDVTQIKRVETKNADTVVIIYFQNLNAGQQIYFDVAGERSHVVDKLKPSAITMYDYYDTEKRATVYYEVKV